MSHIIKPSRKVFSCLTKTFRGGIADNCSRFKFSGDGYKSMPAEQRGEFQIQSARHVAGPMAALLNDFIRLVHIIGATQVLKSIVGDAWVIYVLEHVMRPMLVLFEDEGKADLYCAARLMETVRQHPGIKPMLQDSQKENRHNVTGTWIKTAMMQLLVAGLNEGNVSSLSWPLVWISEAWQHGNDGLMWKSYKRTDRYSDHKILNESQASLVGSDLHVSAREAFQVPLVWTCPACDGEQNWEWQHWNHKRPADFIPRTPKNLQWELPKPDSYGGMKWMDDGGGINSIQERARSAYWECIWCGYHIEDTRAVRQQLMDGYKQNYETEIQQERNETSVVLGEVRQRSTKKISTSSKLTFTLPFESARDNPFSKTVENFLIAKHEEGQGNKVKMADWFMADRALFYSDELLRPVIIQLTGAFDPNKTIDNEHHKGMTVDCQKDLTKDTVGTFHWSVDAADKSGNSFEMARGFAESWEELIGVQKKFKIPNRFVCIDGRKWTPEILQKAAECFEMVKAMQYGRLIDVPSCWVVLLGDAPARHYPWIIQGRKEHRLFAPPTTRVENVIDKNGRKLAIPVQMFRWSHVSVGDALNGLLIGGEGRPKFVAATRESLSLKDQAMETGLMSYDNQMSSEIRGEKSWEKVHSSRPNHRLDIARMRYVRLLMNRLIGYIAPVEEVKS